jgi:phytanoyl-CoA hydroxylase
MAVTTFTYTSQKFFESNPFDYEVDVSCASNLALASEKFSENGFVVLRNVVPLSLIDKIHEDLLHTIDSGLITNKLRDLHTFDDGTVSSAHNLIDYLPSYQALLNLEVIHKVLKLAYGELSSNKFNSSFFAKPKRIGLETKPHQDNAFFCMNPAEVATCWLPVTFANRLNGCLYYYPKSSALGNLSHMPEGNLGASMCLSSNVLSKVESQLKRVYIELNKGDCVLHNSTTVHGSEPNESDTDRNAFNFSIASLKAVRDEDLFSLYKANLNSFLVVRKMDSSGYVK